MVLDDDLLDPLTVDHEDQITLQLVTYEPSAWHKPVLNNVYTPS